MANGTKVKIENPNKRCLLWASHRGWERVREDQLREYMGIEHDLPLIAIAKKCLNENNPMVKVILGRYFDSWDYQTQLHKYQKMEESVLYE